MATFMLTITCQSLAADMTVNEAKGLNAFRCAATSIFNNISTLALAIYYFLKEYGQQGLISDAMDTYYPNICTCKAEIDQFGEYIAGSSSGDDSNAKYIGVCSEAARNSQTSSTASA